MPRSKAEARLAFAVASGKAKDSGMSAKYANEVVSELHKRGPGAMSSLPKHVRKIAGRGVILLAFLFSFHQFHQPARAQTPNTGSVMRSNPFPSGDGITRLLFYSGSNLAYVCSADAIQTTALHAPTWAITPIGAQFTLTSIVVSSNVATVTVAGSSTNVLPTANINLQIGNKLVVAGSATSALNGTFPIASTPSATTVTFAVTVANGTYTDSTLTVSSNAPRTDDNIWSVQAMTYSGANLILTQQAQGVAGSYTNLCSNRANLIYQ
jgi:hypothetical protein